MPSRRRKLLRPYRPLHPLNCEENENNFQYMQDMINIDLRSLSRFQDTQYSLKCPPLMAAYCMRHYKCMEFLLEQGARPEAINSNKHTTMHYACSDHNIQAVEILLKYGLDTNYKSGCGSFLSWAIANQDITRLLLIHGADADGFLLKEYQNSFYISNLSRALRKGHIESAKLLLIYGSITDYSKLPDVHPSSIYLNSFPHCVISGSAPIKTLDMQMKMFDMLRQFGISLYQKNKIGLCVLDVLQFQGIGDKDSKDLAQYLKTLLSEPSSLLNLSRIAIKNACGRNFLEKISVLNELRLLPTMLIEFLKF